MFVDGHYFCRSEAASAACGVYSQADLCNPFALGARVLRGSCRTQTCLCVSKRMAKGSFTEIARNPLSQSHSRDSFEVFLYQQKSFCLAVCHIKALVLTAH